MVNEVIKGSDKFREAFGDFFQRSAQCDTGCDSQKLMKGDTCCSVKDVANGGLKPFATVCTCSVNCSSCSMECGFVGGRVFTEN